MEWFMSALNFAVTPRIDRIVWREQLFERHMIPWRRTHLAGVRAARTPLSAGQEHALALPHLSLDARRLVHDPGGVE
jgi:hypothetical protein